MNYAGEAWRDQKPRVGTSLLRQHFPTGADDEVRGFGWYHLWNQWNQTRHWWRYPQPNEMLTPEEQAATVSPGTAAVHPSKNLVATGFRFDSIVALRDPSTGETLHEWEGPNEGIAALAFSPDGTLLAAGGRSDRDSPCAVRIWNVETKQRIATLTGHTASVGSLEFSPDSALLVSASAADSGDPGETIVWKVDGFTKTQTIPGTGLGIHGLAFGPAGEKLAIAQRGANVLIVNLESGDALPGPEIVSRALAYLPDGRLLLVTDAAEGMVWNPETKSKGTLFTAGDCGCGDE